MPNPSAGVRGQCEDFTMSATIISIAEFNASAAQIVDQKIGLPLYHRDMSNDRAGFICGIKNEMLQIVWDNTGLQQMSVKYFPGLDRFIKAAQNRGMNKITAVEASLKLTAAEKEVQARLELQHKKEEAKRNTENEWEKTIAEIMPEDAQAVIVAELMRDESDTMSDYFSGSVVDTVILAFSSHKRDIFSEMRKAAKNDERTAFLATASKSAEHREKYSMGAGYYLSEGSRYSGWKIRKISFYGERKYVPVGEICKALQKK